MPYVRRLRNDSLPDGSVPGTFTTFMTLPRSTNFLTEIPRPQTPFSGTGNVIPVQGAVPKPTFFCPSVFLLPLTERDPPSLRISRPLTLRPFVYGLFDIPSPKISQLKTLVGAAFCSPLTPLITEAPSQTWLDTWGSPLLLSPSPSSHSRRKSAAP